MRAWLAVFAVAACGGGGTGTGDDDQPDAAVDTPSDAGAQWTTLIERSWQLAPSQEAFKCIRVKIPSEMYISGFRVNSPVGTHHEILTITQTTTPLGSYDCSGANLDKQMLFAGGIQTNDLVFPNGVAIKLPANTYINLNLHLANYSESTISGTSGIQVMTAPASEVIHEADMIFLGNRNFTIPAHSTDYVVTGSCTVPAAWTILQLWPHMHKLGKHQLVQRLNANNQLLPVLNTDYSFLDQKSYPMTVPLDVNNQLKIECVYDNPNNYAVVFGDGAMGEMCFAGFYKYPAGGEMYTCAPLF
jgi:hypothetical protein